MRLNHRPSLKNCVVIILLKIAGLYCTLYTCAVHIRATDVNIEKDTSYMFVYIYIYVTCCGYFCTRAAAVLHKSCHIAAQEQPLCCTELPQCCIGAVACSAGQELTQCCTGAVQCCTGSVQCWTGAVAVLHRSCHSAAPSCCSSAPELPQCCTAVL